MSATHESKRIYDNKLNVTVRSVMLHKPHYIFVLICTYNWNLHETKNMLVYRKSATTIGTLLWIIRLVLIVACLSINDAYWGKTFAETICFSDQNSDTLNVGCIEELCKNFATICNIRTSRKTSLKVKWSQNLFMKSSIFQNTTKKIW